MKKFMFLLFVTVFAVINAQGQRVSCSELISYVEKNGRETGRVSSIQLFDSSWLRGVKAYSIEKTTVVIAEIRRNQYSLYTSKYIFCGISDANWRAFQYGFSDLGTSYGERFHKYIMDNKCNCY